MSDDATQVIIFRGGNKCESTFARRRSNLTVVLTSSKESQMLPNPSVAELVNYCSIKISEGEIKEILQSRV